MAWKAISVGTLNYLVFFATVVDKSIGEEEDRVARIAPDWLIESDDFKREYTELFRWLADYFLSTSLWCLPCRSCSSYFYYSGLTMPVLGMIAS